MLFLLAGDFVCLYFILFTDTNSILTLYQLYTKSIVLIFKYRLDIELI